jgi:hypothetical protein
MIPEPVYPKSNELQMLDGSREKVFSSRIQTVLISVPVVVANLLKESIWSSIHLHHHRLARDEIAGMAHGTSHICARASNCD